VEYWIGGQNMLATIKASFNLLSRPGKAYLLVSVFIQIFISMLDILGIGFIAGAAIFALKLFGTTTNSTSDNTLYRFLNSITNDDRKSIYLLLAFAFIFFIGKTLLSSLLFRKQLKFLTRRDFAISSEAVNRFLNRNLIVRNPSSTQEKVTAMSTGMWLSTSEILGNSIAMLSEFGLLTLIILLLMFADVKLAILTFLYFGLIFLGLYFLLGRNLQNESVKSTHAGLGQQDLLRTMLAAQREIRVFNREIYFANKYLMHRKIFALSSSNVLFLMYLPKMFIEAALIVGVFLLSIYQFLNADAVAAVSTLTLYLAAGTRILPSLLRLQNAISVLRAGIPGAQMFLKLFNDESSEMEDKYSNIRHEVNLDNLLPTAVKIENIDFSYDFDSAFAIKNLSLDVQAGSLCAIVGDSGSGKSTLVDLILGLLGPANGSLNLYSGSNFEPMGGKSRISYVPQVIAIIPGSIRENVNFGANFNDAEIWEALSKSGLTEFVLNLPEKLDTVLYEDGLNLSGGQIQRLAISRALINKPTLLVMDEATSSLDSESHDYINSVIASLKGQVTLISISHNWSALSLFDQIVYLKNGNIIFDGGFTDFKDKFGNVTF